MNGQPTNGTKFWSITVSGVVQITLLVGTFGAFFLTYDRTINDTKNIANQNSRDIASLATTVKEMNERGTNFSQAGIPLEKSMIAALAERANQHEKILSEISPKIERIQTTLEFIVREQKKP